MLARSYPFPQYNVPQLIVAVTERDERPEFPEDIKHPEFKKLIEDCWKSEPDERPTSKEIVKRLTIINNLISS